MAKEIITKAKNMGFSITDLFLEAECVEEYGGSMHIALSGYTAESLREAAVMMMGFPSL